MLLPGGGDRGRPVLRDARYATAEFWAQFVPARPQDEAEHWATPISRLISENAVTSDSEADIYSPSRAIIGAA